ncbi:MAG: hypothetical protein ACK2UO_21785 [Caldilineaceae bacterium]
MFGIVSPADWGLEPAQTPALQPWRQFDVDAEDWEERARQATYHWLMHNWMEDDGAFAGHYSALRKEYEPPQLTNLIAPWHLMAAYDRYGDDELLHKAKRSADWLYGNLVETHPMSMVVGGVRDAWRPEEIWTKFTAEFVIQSLGLYMRLQDDEYLRRALQSVRFLIQAEVHDHACEFDHVSQRWVPRGWQSFGRIIEAFLELYEVTRDNRWLGRALSWGEYSLTLQAPDNCFYLINGEYYNTDLAADELRAFTFLYERTHLPQFLHAAVDFANWHIHAQRPDGAWLLTIDRWSRPVSDYVGPGDVPNIAIAFLRLHHATDDPHYIEAALKAIKYVRDRQAVPGSDQPYGEDENTHWGLWSWDPYYDYSMSGDQITHFVRGIWFALDYLASLSPEQTQSCTEYLKGKV